MSEGTCSVREIADIAEFAELLSGLRTNEALIYGVPKGMDTAKIERNATRGAICIAKTVTGLPEYSSQVFRNSPKSFGSLIAAWFFVFGDATSPRKSGLGSRDARPAAIP
ncbi:hypothetical protein [Yoonia maritima]|uniref:hypothetical protein n=1 Tax=Yoonia maritima TaxID=1435347 RepID=UPI0013A5FCEB|nr:hypothetical protein [Yoonia maritima]